MFFDNVKKLKEERDYWKRKYEELQAQIDKWDAQLTEEMNDIKEETEEVDEELKEIRRPTTFKNLNIPIGTCLYHYKNSDLSIVVLDNFNMVSYNNKAMSINAAADTISEENNYTKANSAWAKFSIIPNGKNLFRLRKEMEANGTYGE